MLLSLVSHTKLNFPSGSSIEKYGDTFFLFGDDCPYFAILDAAYRFQEKVIITHSFKERIPKPIKPDWEACTIIDDYIWVFGSGSLLEKRDDILIIHPASSNFVVHKNHSFYNELRKREFTKEINIEAATMVKEELWLFNRANLSQPNHLIRCSIHNTHINIIDIKEIPDITFQEHVLGISGAAYDSEHDVLWITASAEATENSYDDGAILGSVLYRLDHPATDFNMRRAQKIDLPELDTRLEKQKIESVCIAHALKENYQLLLVADNDIGDTELFHINVQL